VRRLLRSGEKLPGVYLEIGGDLEGEDLKERWMEAI
jgi:hypothetical protein